MKTLGVALTIGLLAMVCCSLHTSTASADEPARRVVIAKVRPVPLPPQAPAIHEESQPAIVKTCPCSPACVCGCNQGKPCMCQVLSAQPVPAPVVTYLQPSMEFVQAPSFAVQPAMYPRTLFRSGPVMNTFRSAVNCGPGG